jgi:nitroimidazol reductase NimA-like FMN-containing flavoprotein (pyridoxamine 5'-phosphate oxidase superfamily)
LIDLPTFSEGVNAYREMSQNECIDLLNHASVGQLACSLDNLPYVVPICFVYEPEPVSVFSTLGQKNLDASKPQRLFADGRVVLLKQVQYLPV